jgi:hypothetical protein
MASRPIEDTVTAPKRKLPRRKGSVRLVDAKGERIPEAVLIEASERFRANHEFARVSRRLERTDRLPIERRSVAKAMLLVEIKVVKALWVLERAVSADGARGHSSRNGIEYMHDRLDQYANAIANGGWFTPAARPAVPSSKEIDEAVKVQRWLGFLDATDARLLTIGAMAKRGDAGRKINWMRVRPSLPELGGVPIRTLQSYYTRALRHMVAELAMRGIN